MNCTGYRGMFGTLAMLYYFCVISFFVSFFFSSFCKSERACYFWAWRWMDPVVMCSLRAAVYVFNLWSVSPSACLFQEGNRTADGDVRAQHPVRPRRHPTHQPAGKGRISSFFIIMSHGDINHLKITAFAALFGSCLSWLVVLFFFFFFPQYMNFNGKKCCKS